MTTQIKVWKEYTGNRAKKPIVEGIYDQGDRKLYGLAHYLIDNGNAREVIVAAAPEPDWEQIEDGARALTIENDVIRAQAIKDEKAKGIPLITTDPQELVEAFVKSVDEMGGALANSEEKVTTKPKRARKGKAKS